MVLISGYSIILLQGQWSSEEKNDNVWGRRGAMRNVRSWTFKVF